MQVTIAAKFNDEDDGRVESVVLNSGEKLETVTDLADLFLLSAKALGFYVANVGIEDLEGRMEWNRD